MEVVEAELLAKGMEQVRSAAQVRDKLAKGLKDDQYDQAFAPMMLVTFPKFKSHGSIPRWHSCCPLSPVIFVEHVGAMMASLCLDVRQVVVSSLCLIDGSGPTRTPPSATRTMRATLSML